MATKKFKTDDAKFTGWGAIELMFGPFQERLEKVNKPSLKVDHPLRVIIEATITYPLAESHEGQEFNLEIGKVKFK